MTTTPLMRADLERVLTALRGRWAPQRIDWDIHRAIDDDAIGSFEPAEHGTAHSFLVWTKTAEASFEKDELTQPLAFQFAGDATALQMAFARENMTVRVDVDEDDDDVFGRKGLAVVPPDALDLGSDLHRLLVAFDALQEEDVVALACAGFTQSDGWSDVATLRAEDERRWSKTSCFWQEQGHVHAFDAVGHLKGVLHLYWEGSAERIATVLRRHDFSVRVPATRDESIQIQPSTSEPPFVPRFRDVLPNEPRVGSKPQIVAVRGGGPFVVESAFASPEKKPVRACAISDDGARVALCHRDDERGSPNKSLVVTDAHGVVIATPSRRAWGSPTALGACFLESKRLDEKRIIVTWLDYLARSELTVRVKPPKTVGGRRVVSRAAPKEALDQKTMCAVLEMIDVDAKGACTHRVLRAFGFDHAPHFAGPGVTRDRRRAAVASPDGVVVVDIETGAELACVGGPPLDAYPALALSADGAHVAWTTDRGPVVRIVDVKSGAHVDARVPQPFRGIRDVAFDPSGAFVVVHCADEHFDLVTLDVKTGAFAPIGLHGAAHGASAFAFHPTEPLVALGYRDGTACVVDVPHGDVKSELVPLLDGHIRSIAFSDDGARFVAGDQRGRVCVGRFGV